MKDPVEYTPAEISAVEDYASQIEHKQKLVLNEDRTDSNEKIDFERKIDETVASFDKSLKELYEMKLEIEKCILAEELKILLHEEKLSLMEDLDNEEEQMK